MATTAQLPSSRARLRWRCRRGLKELDVFFEAFVANGFDELADTDLPGLERLLELPDQDILMALVGDEPRDLPLLDAGMLDAALRIRASLAQELPR